MKRRKTYNKYRIGKEGQIEKKNVILSPRAKAVFGLMAMTSSMIEASDGESYVSAEGVLIGEAEQCAVNESEVISTPTSVEEYSDESQDHETDVSFNTDDDCIDTFENMNDPENDNTA